MLLQVTYGLRPSVQVLQVIVARSKSPGFYSEAGAFFDRY
jgi:hypothetical protein